MSTSIRSEHLEKLIKKIINDIIYKKINDSKIKFVTITRVKLSPKFAHAKIYVTIYDDKENVRRCLKGLKNATKFIRHEMGKHLDLRRVPEIVFLVDQEMLHQYRILDITQKLRENVDNKSEITKDEE